MASKTISPLGIQYFDENGNPLSNGMIYAYAAGTSLHEPTYQDADGAVEHPQPMTLDSEGRVTYFLSPTAYRFVIQDENGVEVTGGDIDGVAALQAAGASSGLDVPAVAGEDVQARDPVYLSDGSGGTIAGRWYRLDADAIRTSLAPLGQGFATGDAVAGAAFFVRQAGSLDGFVGLTPGAVQFASGTPGVLTATAPANARALGVALTSTTLLIQPSWNPFAGLGVCQGRLTLTSGLPVTTADVLAAATLYFTPQGGNLIGLYNGTTGWAPFPFAELSISLAALAINSNFDVFAYDNGGVVALELSAAWNSATAIFGAGTYQTTRPKQHGVYVKSTDGTVVDATRRYLGTIRTTGTLGQTEDSLAKRYVWNYYHRVPRPLKAATEPADSWNYTTAVFRQANANAANQLDLVIGVAEVLLEAVVLASFFNNTSGGACSVGIGEDSTAAAAAGCLMAQGGSPGSAVAGTVTMLSAQLRKYPAVGRHVYPWLEQSVGIGTTTWTGDGGNAALFQTGITGSIDG